MTATGISQKEYLKKYLSSGGDGKKKKKKKVKANPVTSRLRIVDDDVDIHNLRPLNDDELELYNLQEDAPQIAGIIDERPEEVKIKEKCGSSKWKIVADESDMGVKIIDKSKNVGDVSASCIHEGSGDDLSPPRKSRKGTNIQHDSDESPHRKNSQSLDNSPVNKRSQKYDSDESPPRKNKRSLDNLFVDKRSYKHDSGVSPPRKNRRSVDNSPVNKKSKKYDSDESPPRKNRKSKDNSPMNKRCKKYNSDESPPQKNRWSTDNSPVNKRGKKYDSDASPPRKNRRSLDNSPENKRSHNQNPDESSPRRNRRKGQTDVADEFPQHKLKSERDIVQQSKRRRNYDSDESPVRKSRKNTPPKRLYGESPSHRKKRSDSEDNSLRAKGHKYDSDVSPPRKSRKNGSKNSQSPSSRKRYDSDESPPRKTKRKSSESPPRRDVYNEFKASHRKDGSHSRIPQRRQFPLVGRRGSRERSGQRSRKSDSDESPSRHRRQEESSSPPHRGKRRDWSPPKRERKRSPRSPDARLRKGREMEGSQRKHSRWGDVADVSGGAQRASSKHISPTYHRERPSGSSSLREPNRNDHKKEGRNSSSQRRSDSDVSPERKSKMTEKGDSKKQTLDGRKAGLVGADELKAEIADLRRKEKEVFEKMDVSVSGRGVAAILRDRKTGKKRNLEEEALEKQEKDLKQAERDAKYMEWGKGLKQVTDKAHKMEEDLYEMSKPLARYADDADLDKFLRDQEREGDPMLEYIKSKSKTKEESGKPRYEGSFMPNRYGIRPGYRWDGVDRSNGYEKQWFETQNAKKAVEEEAYKWSTSDM